MIWKMLVPIFKSMSSLLAGVGLGQVIEIFQPKSDATAAPASIEGVKDAFGFMFMFVFGIILVMVMMFRKNKSLKLW